MEKTLFKVDKNGTSYYHCKDTCGKCCGRGYIEHFSWNEDGICFDCNGTGYVFYDGKEYTQEYLDKLEKRRLEKAKRERPNKDAKFFRDNGVSENGEAWVVLGNTYEIKDEIKSLGGKYNNIIGWHFDHEVSEFDTYKLTKEDMFIDNGNCYNWNIYGETTVEDIVKSIRKEYEDSHKSEDAISNSDYVANVGDRVDFNLKLIGTFGYETSFGVCYIYKFNDNDGNEIVWKTSTVIGYYDEMDRWYPVYDGDVVKVKGTVKEHNEYKGNKQTIITRCKVLKAS